MVENIPEIPQLIFIFFICTVYVYSGAKNKYKNRPEKDLALLESPLLGRDLSRG